jgi:hypothetical protein
MSFQIIETFKIFGALGGSIIGITYSSNLKNNIYHLKPSLKTDIINPFLQGSSISEDTFFKSVYGLFGLGVGYSFWWATIPISIILLDKSKKR